MRKLNIVLIALVLTLVLTTLIINSIPVLAFNKHGPTPIPGNLFPHPGALHNNQTPKHTVEKSNSPQVMP